MRLGCGYPMGPLALLDLIGLDTAYEILDTMYRQGRNRLHAPAPILKQMVTAGLLGRKTGRGFYTYEAPDSPVVVDDAETPRRRRRHRSSGDRSTRVGVVGSGTMATGIVEVFAKARLRRHLRHPQPREGRPGPRGRHAQPGEGGPARQARPTTARDAALAPHRRAAPTSRTSPSVDLVVEAIAEDLAVKKALFENLDEICRDGAILATTTSSLPVIEIAVGHQRDRPMWSACTSSTRRR